MINAWLIWVISWGGLIFAQCVGIGTVAPTERLHVQGNLRLDGLFKPANDAGAAGQLLFSQGPLAAPVWRHLPSGWSLWQVDAWSPPINTNHGWTCSGCSGSSPWLSDCGSKLRMLGGYNICGSGCYFEKQFTSLPTHSEVFVEVIYFTIDDWYQNGNNGSLDHVSIRLDGSEIARCYPPARRDAAWGPGVRPTNLSVCGENNFQDLGPFDCQAYASHTSSTLTVRISAGLDASSTANLGILAVKIYLR